jgi:hypothetical protein
MCCNPKKTVRLLLIFLFIAILSYADDNRSPQDSKAAKIATRIWSEEEYYDEATIRKRIEEHYQPVVNTLGVLYGDFQLMAKKAGGYGVWYGFVAKMQQLCKLNQHSKKFEEEFSNSAHLLTKIVWPVSYGAAPDVRKSQVWYFARSMPTRYATHKEFLDRLHSVIQFVFPDQSQEFYQRMLNDIAAIGNTHRDKMVLQLLEE